VECKVLSLVLPGSAAKILGLNAVSLKPQHTADSDPGGRTRNASESFSLCWSPCCASSVLRVHPRESCFLKSPSSTGERNVRVGSQVMRYRVLEGGRSFRGRKHFAHMFPDAWKIGGKLEDKRRKEISSRAAFGVLVREKESSH
jgi:hypothetical protein